MTKIKGYLSALILVGLTPISYIFQATHKGKAPKKNPRAAKAS
ncbi:MAG: hypothetical protein AB8G05_21200 [Oligoflexales bacterium]